MLITEEQYITYFENLAVQSKEINHKDGGARAFAYVNDPDDLDQFDEVLRSATKDLYMLLLAESGTLHDNDSEAYNQTLNCGLFIVARKSSTQSIAQVRDRCLPIIVNLMGRLRRDARKNKIVPGNEVNFTIKDLPYEKVGPMMDDWYGYVVYFPLNCPFGYTVDSAIWRDINP